MSNRRKTEMNLLWYFGTQTPGNYDVITECILTDYGYKTTLFDLLERGLVQVELGDLTRGSLTEAGVTHFYDMLWERIDVDWSDTD